MLRSFLALCALSFLLVSGIASLQAQITSADVLGTVTDSSGAALPNATVTITNLDTHDTRSVTSNQSGGYVFTFLPTGHYTLKVEAAGFKEFTVPSITLGAGDRQRVEAQMSVGERMEKVEVQAEATALQTDSAEVGTLTTNNAVQNLPLNGRNFMNLVQLVPGGTEGAQNDIRSGTRPDDRRQSSSVTVGGASRVNFLIDGMDNNDRTIFTIIVRPAIDAIQEIKISTNTFTSEVGLTDGAVVNLITKSGTNAIHGTLFEYFRNDKLDGKPFFSLPGPKPEFRLNQYGGSIGGPIRKDKTFYFGDFERYDQRQARPYLATVPTTAMLQGNFAGIATIFDPATTVANPRNPSGFVRTAFPNNQIPASRFDSVAKNFLNLYPAPNLPGLASNYGSDFVRAQDSSTFDIKVDHHFNEQNSLYARFSYNNTSTITPQVLPEVNGIFPTGQQGVYPGPAHQDAMSAQLNFVHLFSPNFLMELRGGYGRFALHSLPFNAGTNVNAELGLTNSISGPIFSGMALMQPAGYETLGDAGFIPLIQFDNVYQEHASFTKTQGTQTIKFGADLIRRQWTVYQSGYPRGQFSFDGNATNDPSGVLARSGNAIASMLLGYPGSLQVYLQPVLPGYRAWEVGGYVQDDWRVKPWLTLNLGARYDVFTPETEVANRLSNVSFASRGVVVAGLNGSNTAGVQTDWHDVAPRFGFAISLPFKMVFRGGFGLSFFPANGGNGSQMKNAPFTSGAAIINSTTQPTYTVSQGLPPALPQNPANPNGTMYALAANFKSTYGEQISVSLQKEFAGNLLSVGYSGELTRHNVIIPNVNQPLPGPGTLAPRREFYSTLPNATSIYYTTSDGTLDYHSLQVVLERRLRRGLTLSGSYVWSHALAMATGSGGAGSQVITNYNLDFGSAPVDVRHRWVGQVNYQLPFGSSFTGFKRVLVQGWQVSAIGVWQSGMPFTVTNNTARVNTGSGDRPNRTCNGTLSNPTIQEWFDVSCFVTQPLYTPGNSGVFILEGPTERFLNLSFLKSFHVTESKQLEFRAESFNLTNTPNFANPNTALGSSTFGTVSALSVFANPRQIQFALKLLF